MKTPHMLVLVWEDRQGHEGGGTLLHVKPGINAKASETFPFADIKAARDKAIELIDEAMPKFANVASSKSSN